MTDRPKRFYYYSSITSDERRTWISEILIDHKVYFRPRSVLNDPAELRPTLRYDAPKKELREFSRKFIEQYGPRNLSPAQRLALLNQTEQRYRKNPESMESILHDLLDNIGILSLSSTPDEPLLWAHYAEGHRGIAIEFDASSGLFSNAIEIKYPPILPTINRVQDNSSQIFEKAALTKTEKWSYEKEWRVVARWADEKRNHIYSALDPELARFMRSQRGPGHYQIPPKSITGIVLGCNISDTSRNWILEKINQSGLILSVSKATPTREGALRIEV